MPYYHRLGDVPHKRHTVFPQTGGGLYYERLMGNLGFAGLQSLVYHVRRPTSLLATALLRELRWEADPDSTLRLRHFFTHRLPPPGPSPVLDRTPLLFNRDIALSLARPSSRSGASCRFARVTTW